MISRYKVKNFIQDEFGGKLNEFKFSYQDCFCGEKNYEIISTKTRTGQNFTTAQCIKCGTLRINPYMTEESTDKYYKEIYGLIKRGNISALDLFKRQQNDAHKVYSFLKEYVNQNSNIVDFGGGAGGKTHLFAKNDYNISIIESDERYRNFAIENGFNKDSNDEKYDLIILLHVFEHIVEPIAFLHYLEKMKLNKDGLVYIEVPFLGGVEYGRNILNEIHIAHKWYFTKSSLDSLFGSAGFEIIARNDERSGVLIKKSDKFTQDISKLFQYGKKESNRAIMITKFIYFLSIISIYKRIIRKYICK